MREKLEHGRQQNRNHSTTFGEEFLTAGMREASFKAQDKLAQLFYHLYDRQVLLVFDGLPNQLARRL